MNRQFPVYIIEGTKFNVDVEKGELSEKDNPSNVIKFEDMTYTGSGYKFNYDCSLRNLPLGIYEQNVKEKEIPMKVVLDPEKMAEICRLPVEDLNRKTDYDLLVNENLVRERLNGVLPVVDIAGQDFIVDYRLYELRPKDDFSTSIQLKGLHYDYEAEKYQAFYDPATHCVVEVDGNTITEMPDGLVLIEIPLECKLDPVATAREFGVDMKAMLVKHPPQEKMKINVVPVEKTNLSKLVERNRNSLKDRQLSKQNNHKVSRRI